MLQDPIREERGLWYPRVLGSLSNLVLKERLYQERKGEGNSRQREQHEQELGGTGTRLGLEPWEHTLELAAGH